MGHGGNVIDELVTDHREVEEFFGRIEALPAGAKDRRLYADQATMELVRHSVAEEMYLYPAVREHVPGGDALADRELQDHAQAEQLMKDLEGRRPDAPEFDRLVGTLMSEIRAHVADEEENLFPRPTGGREGEATGRPPDRARAGTGHGPEPGTGPGGTDGPGLRGARQATRARPRPSRSRS